MGIDIHPFAPRKSYKSYTVILRIGEGHAGRCGSADQDRYTVANNFCHDLTGNPAAGEEDFILHMHVIQKCSADQFVNGIMPANIFCKKNNLVFISQGSTVHPAGFLKKIGN